MSHKNHYTVLSISPKVRNLGVAVFEDEDLLYYGVKEIGRHHRRSSKDSLAREALRITEELISKYRPQTVALRKLTQIQEFSPKLDYLAAQLDTFVHHRHLDVTRCWAITARQSFCQYHRATKAAVAARLAEKYPELSRYIDGISCWQRLYYAPMFDALAIGYYCQQQRTVKAQRPSEYSVAPRDSSAIISN